ncbi:troponin I, slow skeletal muscle-like [Lampris incognitus]|uniref:troponin I, slow skeletal muscle-like n=1 Tax=Lampris incognitus TaxID=2546036 RepID=UPI0024B5E72C|nr:troponin I, slow skeletal muscle-like [Lampris incognitus]
MISSEDPINPPRELSPLAQRKPKYSATRRLLLKSKLLKRAEVLLEEEHKAKITERETALKKNAPPLSLSGLSLQELQEVCKDLHRKIDIVDEERYDIQVKVAKNEKEIQSLSQKISELKSYKKPNLKKVKRSGDVLGGLAEAKLSAKADFKANLKTVKKEEEKKEEVTDWRKNVEALSGMEGRKKKFSAQQ